jgi:hypothetical protein
MATSPRFSGFSPLPSIPEEFEHHPSNIDNKRKQTTELDYLKALIKHKKIISSSDCSPKIRNWIHQEIEKVANSAGIDLSEKNDPKIFDPVSYILDTTTRHIKELQELLNQQEST